VCAGGRAAVTGNPELGVGDMVDNQDGDHRRPLHRRCAEPGRLEVIFPPWKDFIPRYPNTVYYHPLYNRMLHTLGNLNKLLIVLKSELAL
jgi:hypothetical protein